VEPRERLHFASPLDHIMRFLGLKHEGGGKNVFAQKHPSTTEGGRKLRFDSRMHLRGDKIGEDDSIKFCKKTRSSARISIALGEEGNSPRREDGRRGDLLGGSNFSARDRGLLRGTWLGVNGGKKEPRRGAATIVVRYSGGVILDLIREVPAFATRTRKRGT